MGVIKSGLVAVLVEIILVAVLWSMMTLPHALFIVGLLSSIFVGVGVFIFQTKGTMAAFAVCAIITAIGFGFTIKTRPENQNASTKHISSSQALPATYYL